MQYLKCAALYALKGIGAFHLARHLTCRQLRILCYHGFSVGDQHEFEPILFMRPQVFRRRMQLLRRRGFRVVSLRHGLALLRSGAVRNGEVVITIDDGWKSTLAGAAPALLENSLPATLYVTTYYTPLQTDVFNVALEYLAWKTALPTVTLLDVHPAVDGTYTVPADRNALAQHWVAALDDRCSPAERQAVLPRICSALGLDPQVELGGDRFRMMDAAEIARCRHLGIDVQLHTHRHRLPPEEAAETLREVRDNRAVLEPAKGESCTHLCYPSGRHAPEHGAWLRAAGVESATTCDPGLNSPGTPDHYLRRHLDRDDDADIELEAELCGVTEIARRIRDLFQDPPSATHSVAASGGH